MKYLLLSILVLSGLALNAQEASWGLDLLEAKEEAKTSEKAILLSFSGSDWCASCMRLDKDLFQSEEFISFAEENLILLKADFPMKKANLLSEEQTAHNEQLAEQYNKKGAFPTTIILDAEGNVIAELPAVCKDLDMYISLLEDALN